MKGSRFLFRSHNARAQEKLLRQQLEHADKMTRHAEDLQARGEELMFSIKATYPRHEAAAAKLRATKGEFEAALSKLLEGRRVNLMGEISSV